MLELRSLEFFNIRYIELTKLGIFHINSVRVLRRWLRVVVRNVAVEGGRVCVRRVGRRGLGHGSGRKGEEEKTEISTKRAFDRAKIRSEES